MHHHIRNLIKVLQEGLKSLDDLIKDMEQKEFIEEFNKKETEQLNIEIDKAMREYKKNEKSR